MPFRLCISDGTTFELRHPEMVLVSRTIIAVALGFCDPVHIIRIELAADGRPKAKRSSENELRPLF